MPRRKKCKFCGEWFTPHIRLKQRQVTCGKEKCRKSHKRFLNHRRKAKALRNANARDWKSNHKERVKRNNQIYYKKNKHRFQRR